MKKRFLSAILTICMLVSLLPILVFADVGDATPSETIGLSEAKDTAESSGVPETVTEAPTTNGLPEGENADESTTMPIGSEELGDEALDGIALLSAAALVAMADTTPPILNSITLDKTTVEAG